MYVLSGTTKKTRNTLKHIYILYTNRTIDLVSIYTCNSTLMSNQEGSQSQELYSNDNIEEIEKDRENSPIESEKDYFENLGELVKKISIGSDYELTTINTIDNSDKKYFPSECPSEEDKNTFNSRKAIKEGKHALQVEADSRSIFVGNISANVTPEAIEEHFQACGTPKRITLLYDKNTGAPKGYAYVEFDDQQAQEKALDYNGTELKGSNINVYKKRTNLPGYRRHPFYQRYNFYYPHQWNFPYESGLNNFGEMSSFPPQFQYPTNDYLWNGTYNNHYVGGWNAINTTNKKKKQYKNTNHTKFKHYKSIGASSQHKQNSNDSPLNSRGSQE